MNEMSSSYQIDKGMEDLEDIEGKDPIILDTTSAFLNLCILKVPPAIGSLWRESPAGDIVAMSNSQSTQQLEAIIIPSLEATGDKVTHLQVEKMTTNVHLYLMQSRKKKRNEGDPNSFHLGQFPTSSGVRIVSPISGTFTVRPSINAAYRASLKKRLEKATKPASRTQFAPTDHLYCNGSDVEGSQHLFKYYEPDEGMSVTDLSRKERPLVAVKDKGGRMSEDFLKETIFKIFELHGDQGVMLKDFQKKIKVSQSLLRGVLEELGECVSRGGHRPRWFLKKEYLIE